MKFWFTASENVQILLLVTVLGYCNLEDLCVLKTVEDVPSKSLGISKP